MDASVSASTCLLRSLPTMTRRRALRQGGHHEHQHHSHNFADQYSHDTDDACDTQHSHAKGAHQPAPDHAVDGRLQFEWRFLVLQPENPGLSQNWFRNFGRTNTKTTFGTGTQVQISWTTPQVSYFGRGATFTTVNIARDAAFAGWSLSWR